MPVLVFQRCPLQQEGAAMNHEQAVISEVPYTLQDTVGRLCPSPYKVPVRD